MTKTLRPFNFRDWVIGKYEAQFAREHEKKCQAFRRLGQRRRRRMERKVLEVLEGRQEQTNA
jgi:hypothetical protein